jgi:cytochrome c oxidase cbb3-type subunit 3
MSRLGRRSRVAFTLTAATLVTWLIRTKPSNDPPAPQNRPESAFVQSGPELLSREEEAGRMLFERYCSSCHGREGDGFGINAPNLPIEVPSLAAPTHATGLSDARVFDRIARGGRASGGPPVCPAWGHRLTDREIDALVAFLRILSRGGRSDRRPS